MPRLAGALAALPCSALAQPADEAGPPRTPWGVPDLQASTWSLPTMTPLERPAEFEDRLRLTEEEEEEAEFLATRRSSSPRGARSGPERRLRAGRWRGRPVRDIRAIRAGRAHVARRLTRERAHSTHRGRPLPGEASARSAHERLPEGPEDRALDERCLQWAGCCRSEGVRSRPGSSRPRTCGHPLRVHQRHDHGPAGRPAAGVQRPAVDRDLARLLGRRHPGENRRTSTRAGPLRGPGRVCVWCSA